MAYQPPNSLDYEDTLHGLLHVALDQLIHIGSLMEAHSDILATHEVDDEGNMEKLPDVHPEKLLKAQLNLDGVEDEAEATQDLVRTVSRILIVRRARQLIQSNS
jgi:hypothetical protein